MKMKFMQKFTRIGDDRNGASRDVSLSDWDKGERDPFLGGGDELPELFALGTPIKFLYVVCM